MELVPILSTIILVGTIATFILAVAAYILYKARERRSGRARPEQPASRREPHFLVEPSERPAPGVLTGRRPESSRGPGTGDESGAPSERRPEITREPGSGATPPQHESLFWEYTDEGIVPVRPGADEDVADESEESSARGRPAWR